MAMQPEIQTRPPRPAQVRNQQFQDVRLSSRPEYCAAARLSANATVLPMRVGIFSGQGKNRPEGDSGVA
jgi:hypothetical protein